MAIVKKSRSGKSVLFIDDDGNVFVTSVFYLQKLLDGSSKAPFLLLKRFPNRVTGHFKPSPVIDVEGSSVVDSFDRKVLRDSDMVKLGGKDFEV